MVPATNQYVVDAPPLVEPRFVLGDERVAVADGGAGKITVDALPRVR